MKKADNPTVIACVPTYCEPEKVTSYLKSCRNLKYRPFRVIVVNANPGDATSEIIEQEKQCVDYELIEIFGQSNEFWSATINRGLRKILEISNSKDWILISNIDIEFSTDVISLLVQKALEYPMSQMGALCLSHNVAISSGVQIKSWVMTSHFHPFAGTSKVNIPNDLCVRVNLLATRCMLIPVEAVAKSGLVAERLLPHYGADMEFSHRLCKSGYVPYIYTGACINVDTSNTGQSIYNKESKLLDRILSLMSIRNLSNPWYRTILVLLIYPWYAWPTAISAYLLRTLIETLLSKNQIKLYFGHEGRGYPG